VDSPQQRKPESWPANRLDDKRADADVEGPAEPFKSIDDYSAPHSKAAVFGREALPHLWHLKGVHLSSACLEKKSVPQASSTHLENGPAGRSLQDS
jgi:hypothetical protein